MDIADGPWWPRLQGPPCGPPTLNRTPITGRSCHRRPNGNKMVYWAGSGEPEGGNDQPA